MVSSRPNTTTTTAAVVQVIDNKIPEIIENAANLARKKKEKLLELSNGTNDLKNIRMKNTKISLAKRTELCNILDEEAKLSAELSKLTPIDEFDIIAVHLCKTNNVLKTSRNLLNELIKKYPGLITPNVMTEKDMSNFALSKDCDEFLKLGADFKRAWEEVTAMQQKESHILAVMKIADEATPAAYPLRARLTAHLLNIKRFENNPDNKDLKEDVQSAKQSAFPAQWDPKLGIHVT